MGLLVGFAGNKRKKTLKNKEKKKAKNKLKRWASRCSLQFRGNGVFSALKTIQSAKTIATHELKQQGPMAPNLPFSFFIFSVMFFNFHSSKAVLHLQVSQLSLLRF
jgi:hypothetical protein